MELTITHLYPDVMSLYGEYANIAVLRRHLEAMGVTVRLEKITCEDQFSLTDADFIYMGAGTERKQKLVLAAAPQNADALKSAVQRGAVLLFTGNAMETLGASVTAADGQTWPGYHLADFTTKEFPQRDPGDILASTSLWESDTVGFMNKCTETYGITTPLFEQVYLGFGNEENLSPEGYVNGNIFATHITGPVLVKNPAFLDFIITRLFHQKGWDLPETLPILPHEREAYAVTLRELQARIK